MITIYGTVGSSSRSSGLPGRIPHKDASLNDVYLRELGHHATLPHLSDKGRTPPVRWTMKRKLYGIAQKRNITNFVDIKMRIIFSKLNDDIVMIMITTLMDKRDDKSAMRKRKNFFR